MITQPRIAIIGGGIGGAALALFLDKAGMTSTVYEAGAPDRGAAGAGLQIAPNGMNILAQLGLADALIARGAPATTMRFRNARGKLLSDVTFQLPEKYRYPAVNAGRQVVRDLLVGELRGRGVPIHFGKRLVTVAERPSAAACLFDDGSEIAADVVVGADGLHSRVRAALMPNGPAPAYTGLIGAGGFVDPAALERVPPKAALEMIYGRVGFFGLGFVDERHSSESLMWWSAIPAPPLSRERLASLTDCERRAMLLAVHRGWCAPVETTIRQSATPVFMDNIYDIRRLPYWSRGRVVLMGDAAHAVSPHSGQGASMALEDALVLACHVRDHLASPQEAIRRFEKDRRARAERVVEMGRRSGNQKKKLGTFGAWARDRFVSLVLPTLLERTTPWLYNYQPVWTDRPSSVDASRRTA